MKNFLNRRSFIKMITLGGLVTSAPGWAGNFQLKKQESLSPLLINSKGTPIKTLAGWTKERKVIRKRWLDFLGALPPNPDPPKLTVLTEDRPEGMIRQYVSYEGEPGVTVQGYLIKPGKIEKPLPGILAMHSTSDTRMKYIAGVEKGEIIDFGYQLAKRGFVVFCPHCFLWQDNDGRNWEQQALHFQQTHPGSKGMAKMLFDAQRAVDILENLEEVDTGRIGAMGHSLGAKEVFYLTAFDDRVRATVSNEGGIGIDFSNWDAPWYLGGEIHDFGHQHHELLALAAPRPFLVIGGDFADGEQTEAYIEAVKPVYALYGKDKVKNIQLKNHGQGHHAVPEAQRWTYDWMIRYLKPAD